MHSGGVKQLINITTEGGGNLLAPVCQQTSLQHHRTPLFYRYNYVIRIIQENAAADPGILRAGSAF